MRGSVWWSRLLSSDPVAVRAHTFFPRGGSFLLEYASSAGVCLRWSELLVAWLACAAASVAEFTGPGLITWVIGCTIGTILLCVQHSGAQFVGLLPVGE